MERSRLLIFVLLAFVVFIRAGPISEISKRKLLSEGTYEERSRLLDQLTRERREVDYYDWRQFLPKCNECDVLSIGNGRKNKNTVTFNGQMPKDILNIGNGYKNTNTVTFNGLMPYY